MMIHAVVVSYKRKPKLVLGIAPLLLRLKTLEEVAAERVL